VSAWPAGAALGPDDVDDVPWEDAAVLLARLHAPPALAAATRIAQASMRSAVPRARPCRRLDRALRRLEALDDPWAREVLRAYATLPPWVRRSGVRPGGTATLIHGDWHLGQLLRPPGRPWRIIDIDDVGLGDPAWDLARPAAWFAAGLLAPQAWERLLRGYLAAGGSALGAGGGDVWAALDGPARALTVQYAAIALAERGSGGAAGSGGEPADPTAMAFVDCCRRMAASAARGADPIGRLPASSGVRLGSGELS
jgi:aminoglycoside phosphotransferase (APT) family kinase protein